MPPAIVAAALVLIALAGASLVYWSVALWRIAHSLRSVPTARAGLSLPAPPDGWPSVCIIVPAHNERDVIGGLAASLRRQEYPRLRVVFALDRCTDDTAGVLREAISGDDRFEVVEVTSCPEGWAGKVHAACRGAQDSRAARDAELLLFTDADTIFDPACVRATVALLHAGLGANPDASEPLDMLSLLSTLTHHRWWERIAQPAAAFELMRHFSPSRVNRAGPVRPAFANGQFMLFTRSAYESIGGHEAVRGELLEDLAFARLIRNSGTRIGLVLADRLLHCRMYATWDAFRKGWKRIYTESAKRKPERLRAWATRLVVTAAIFPFASLACLVTGALAISSGHAATGATGAAVGAAALAVWALTMAAIHRAQHAPLWTVAAQPIGAWLVAGVLREAARDLRAGRGVSWGGKTYARATR